HEVDLVVEELVRLYLIEQEEGDVDVGIRPGDAPLACCALAVGRVDRASLEQRMELCLLLEQIHVLSIYGRPRARQISSDFGDDLVPVRTSEERFHAPL